MQTFGNACRRYDGPKLQWLVAACRAPDGSYWALQSWPRMLPNYGLNPSPRQAAWELRLSHWKGALPVLEVKSNWTNGRFDQIYGRFTYIGKPVYGFRTTPTGVPLDSFGRNRDASRDDLFARRLLQRSDLALEWASQVDRGR